MAYRPPLRAVRPRPARVTLEGVGPLRGSIPRTVGGPLPLGKPACDRTRGHEALPPAPAPVHPPGTSALEASPPRGFRGAARRHRPPEHCHDRVDDGGRGDRYSPAAHAGGCRCRALARRRNRRARAPIDRIRRDDPNDGTLPLARGPRDHVGTDPRSSGGVGARDFLDERQGCAEARGRRAASGCGLSRRLVHDGVVGRRDRQAGLAGDRERFVRLEDGQPGRRRHRICQPRLDGAAHPVPCDHGGQGTARDRVRRRRPQRQPVWIASHRKAAAAVLRRLRRELPDAVIVVIGPIWANGSPPAAIRGIRTELRRQAATIGAVFVDPIREGWFTGSAERFILADGIHPSNAGHRRIAARVLAVLDALR